MMMAWSTPCKFTSTYRLGFTNTSHSRGKKFWRKFDDKSEGQEIEDSADLDAELDAIIPPRLRGSLSRSAIKPRLLFQTNASPKEESLTASHDEEAVTDIEATDAEATDVDEAMVEFTTPVELSDQPVATPKAPRFAPASPPISCRTTRSQKTGSSSPPGTLPESDGVKHGKKISLFADLPRTKVAVAAFEGRKRDHDADLVPDAPLKRRRGARSS